MKYFTNGTLDDAAFTGITLMVFKTNAAGEITGGYRDQNGNPFFGYMAQEITEAEYAVWQQRLANPDMVTYFPSPMGGLLNQARYDEYQALQADATKQNQTITPLRAKLTLIDFGAYDALIAGINAIADPTERARAQVWFSDPTDWVYKHPMVTMVLGQLGIDKDVFFAAAQAQDV